MGLIKIFIWILGLILFIFTITFFLFRTVFSIVGSDSMRIIPNVLILIGLYLFTCYMIESEWFYRWI